MRSGFGIRSLNLVFSNLRLSSQLNAAVDVDAVLPLWCRKQLMPHTVHCTCWYIVMPTRMNRIDIDFCYAIAIMDANSVDIVAVVDAAIVAHTSILFATVANTANENNNEGDDAAAAVVVRNDSELIFCRISAFSIIHHFNRFLTLSKKRSECIIHCARCAILF